MNSDWSDDQLQQFLEEGGRDINDISPSAEKDLQTYRLLFEGLKELRDEPASELTPGFAVRVTKRITRRNRAQDILFYLLAAVITLAVVALIYGLLLISDRQNAGRFALYFNKYYGVFIFVLMAILCVQWLDQRLLKLTRDHITSIT